MKTPKLQRMLFSGTGVGLAACVLLLAGSGRAQWLEKTIYVPDSLSGVAEPDCIVYDSANNTVYVGSSASPCLIAIDATTGQKTAKIPLVGPVSALACNPVTNRIYCGHQEQTRVSVIDGATNSVLVHTAYGSRPVAICCDRAHNLIYCASSGNPASLVYVIDGATNWVVTAIDVAVNSLRFLCYNSVSNKVYCAGCDSALCVIDCVRESVTATLAVYPGAICFNPALNKLYCISGVSAVLAIDGVEDSVTASITVPGYGQSLCYDAANNRVYCTTGGDLMAIDCREDSIIADVQVSNTAGLLCYNPMRNNLFCICSGGPRAAWVIDCATFEVTNVLFLDEVIETICGVPAADRVFATSREACGLVMIEGSGDSAFAGPTLGAEPWAFCSNPNNNKVYCADRLPGWITAFNAGNGAIRANVRVARNLIDLCYSSGGNKVYGICEFDSSITVVDGASDSVIAHVRLDPESQTIGLDYNPSANKVYCVVYGTNDNGAVAVVDCIGDSVRATVPVGTIWSGPALVCNPTDNKVYCVTQDSIAIIDGAGDSILRSIPVNAYRRAICYSLAYDKVYCSTEEGLVVIDGAQDSVLTTIGIPGGATPLCADRTGTQVYCTKYPGLTVINCATDSITDSIWCNESVSAICCDRTDDLLFLVTNGDNRLAVVDCASNRIIGTMALGFEPAALFWDSLGNRVYAANAYGSCVAVLRPSSAVNERSRFAVTTSGLRPTFVRGTLSMPMSAFTNPRSRLALLDITGRRVAELRPGSNDVSSLAPGIYFVPGSGARGATARKIILTR